MDRKPNSSYQRSGFAEDRDQKKETGFIEDEIWDQKGRRGEEGEGELSGRHGLGYIMPSFIDLFFFFPFCPRF